MNFVCTLYCILLHDFDQSDKGILNTVQYLLRWWKSFGLLSVVYSQIVYCLWEDSYRKQTYGLAYCYYWYYINLKLTYFYYCFLLSYAFFIRIRVCLKVFYFHFSCPFCKTHLLFEDYEAKLFSFTERYIIYNKVVMNYYYIHLTVLSVWCSNYNNTVHCYEMWQFLYLSKLG